VNELIERLRAAFEGLTPRERILVSAAAGTLLLVVLWLGLSSVLSAQDSARSGAGSAEQQLEAMRRLRREYDEVTSRLALVEQQIQGASQNRNTLTLLEGLAAASGVKVESMEERQAQQNDRYRETKVEVELRSVTLTHMVNYLHNIESAPQLLSVKSLRVKTRKDDTLDVTFSVSSFEPI